METRNECVDDQGAPDSWELADLDESMQRLLVSSKACGIHQAAECTADENDNSNATNGVKDSGLEERINQVDLFLREAIQNPRERLSVLRIEQDIERFIQNPRQQQQLEFSQLPTSYLRLAAHRLAQHYNLQSMVVTDSTSLDLSGTKIIVLKTNETRYPPIRLADIPVNLPQDEKNIALKVAIKQRPQKNAHGSGHAGMHSSKQNHSKSVEERKEEYNKARARIFSMNSPNLGGKSAEEESAVFANWQCCSMVTLKTEEKPSLDELRSSHPKVLSDCSSGNGRINKSKGERESAGKVKTNNRVAIFRDRETDRKDPDYDRNYDRYTQRFDPGFGFNMGPYNMQAIYAPAVNYNTEFPQLGAPHRAQMPVEPPPRPIPQHIRSPWLASTSTMGYGALDTMMGPFNPNHMGAPSASAMYMHSSQFACPGPAMAYVRPHERIQPSFSHPSLQQQPEASFGQARPR